MAAPKLTFGSGGGGAPPPPAPIQDSGGGSFLSDAVTGFLSTPKAVIFGQEDRDPKKHSLLANLFAGAESIPRGLLDQEEQVRHAVAKDITEAHGAAGFITLPAHLGQAATVYAITGKKSDRDKLRKIAHGPWDKKESALNKTLDPIIKGGYEQTREATGTRGLDKFKEIWHDNPVAAIGGVAILAPPAFRLAGIARMSKVIRASNRVPLKGGGTRAMTKAEATKAATVETYYPGTLDREGINGSPFSPRSSGRKVSRTPTGRAGQRAFDWTSEKIDAGIGIGERRTGPDTPLSKTRRDAAGARRADDLQRGRLVTHAMRNVSTFADYLNDGLGERVGTALGRRRETLSSRDAAVGAALHASSAIDPVDAVKFVSDDAKAIIASGERDAHNGDIGDLAPHQRVGQTVYVTHGMDEDGAPIREEATVTADHGDRVTVATPDGEQTITHNRAHLLGPNGEGRIPLSEDEVKMLTRRAALLDTAHDELRAEPRLQEKFRAATQSMAHLAQQSEDLGISYATRGMAPTGSEALAVIHRFDARRNQFLPRTGGEGVEPINFQEGLWKDLIDTLTQTGNFTDEQIRLALVMQEHAARVWANEVPGRNPADYLSSPEGKNLGGIDFAHPEDLEAMANAMFQREGERNHLVRTTTTVLITAPAKVGDLVSTPKGMGFLIRRFDPETDIPSETGTMATVEMSEGGAVHETFPFEQLRLSNFPWRGNPQLDDYVMTPDGVGRLDMMDFGPAPDFETNYSVTLFDDVNGMFVDGERKSYVGGEVQRVEDPRNPGEDTPVFHLASQQALGQPGFPGKATSEQYRAALEKAGVKAEEFYWMSLSRRPMLEDAVAAAEREAAQVDRKLAEDPQHDAVYGAEERDRARLEVHKARERLADYAENPDESMLLDANWGGKSFPVQALRDAVDSRSHFLDLKETLYSSNAPNSQWRDRWGPSGNYGGGGLIIRTPTHDQPYHELILQLPHNELQAPNPHWSGISDSPLVHIRFHEIVDNEGNRAILIDELQSDWNNAGRTQGWREILTPHDRTAAARLRDKERRLHLLYNQAETKLGMSQYQVNDWLDRQIGEKANEMNAEIDIRNEAVHKRAAEAQARGEMASGAEFATEPRLVSYGYDRGVILERLERDRANDPEFKDMMKERRRLARLMEKTRHLREAADAIEMGAGSYSAITRGPLVMGDAAKYLAMKRLIRWAADHGQTRIIWTRGHEQGVRYGKFDDLPIREDYGGGHDPGHPSDHGNDFYYPENDTRISMGQNYRLGDVSPEKLHRMQQAQPIEVKYNDLDEYGGDYVLLPNGHPADTGASVVHPDQMSLTNEGADIPFAAASNERWAKVVHETDDGVVALPVDPKWDPAKVDIDYRGSTGDDSYATFTVKIVNRLGEKIYSGQVDGSIGDYSDLLAAVKKDWERPSYYVSGHRESLAPDTIPGQENLANDSSSTPLGTNAEKMSQMLDILEQSDTFQSEFDYMINNANYELDGDSWSEYVSESQSEHGEGGRGDFSDIRDHEAYGQRRVRNLREGIATLERQKQADIERGVMSRDYNREIAEMKLGLKAAESNMENKGHTLGYDRMLPQMATRMLKPYRKEADHAPVEIKKGIYEGRYGTEGDGPISDEGDIHGWAMDLPKKMLKDAKEDTTSLFQRGNDIIKGASTWVGGPDGQRFISLTEHADFSTLMHEFVGHATVEMKRRYPELWEAVETDMGRPLEQWTRPQHEKFAKWVERYFMEGKAPSPELVTVMRMVKEWMKGVYSSITQLGRPMPQSTRALLDRHLGQGVTARPGARAYVPHVSQFDTMMDTAPGGTRLAAGGNVVGVPNPDKRTFATRRNRGILWQTGELALSARPIIDQYFRRTKFMETEALRQEMYDGGHPMPRNGRPPSGAWLVRNPEKGPERLTARNKTRLSEEDFSRLIGEGDTPEEFVTKMAEIRQEHYAEPGEHPDWANDLENTRWVEGGKVKARIQNVFPSAPRGRAAASLGSVNAMARLTGIYLRPLHYLVGNIPQNVLMIALTNPSALVNSAKYGAYSFLPRVVREVGIQPRDLFAHDRALYNEIKTETGDIQAGAGLPDFYTMANNRFQKAERRLNKISQGSAEKLGELADQPYRVSVWMAHAKGYNYNTPDEWRQLLHSERGTPEARIRDDIAQSTREDMIDFNTLSPGERQHISRFFYLWAFTRGFAKWPVTFAREYPGRTGVAMLTADPGSRDDNGLLLSSLPGAGILKSNKGGGRIRDLGFLDPTGGLRQQVETGIQVAHGNFSGLGGMTTPPLETALQAVTGGPRAPKGGLRGFADQIARDTVPFWDIGRKALPGKLGGVPRLSKVDRVLRVLDFTDRFGVKPEIGRGKNADKKRAEDAKIRSTLKAADRMDALPLVMHQQDAYWHWKYLEQQIRFGAQARRKGTTLTGEEKLTILYATAADYFPTAALPKLSEALKQSAAYQEELRSQLSEGMFGARNEVTGA